jgi:hypothetical protein
MNSATGNLNHLGGTKAMKKSGPSKQLYFQIIQKIQPLSLGQLIQI